MTIHETTFGDQTAIFPDVSKSEMHDEPNFFGVLDAILGDDKETDNESDIRENYQSQ
jgi:hypothetical protein